MAAFAGVPAFVVWSVSRRLPLRYRVVLVISIAAAVVSFLLCMNYCAGLSGVLDSSGKISVSGVGAEEGVARWRFMSGLTLTISALCILMFVVTTIVGLWSSRRTRKV